MGTDIHWHVETMDERGDWHHAEIPADMKPRWWKEDDPEYGPAQWEMDRNYGLFSILAGVRNGSGFAGSPMGDLVDPIAEPRGLPKEREKFYKKHVDHDASWLTLEELIDHDWSKSTERCGVISHSEWCLRKKLNVTDPPRSYSGDINGQGDHGVRRG